MLIVSVVAFFTFVFLLATIAVTVAWMGFLKRSAEQSEAALTEVEIPDEGSGLFRNERSLTKPFSGGSPAMEREPVKKNTAVQGSR